jgi:hypothetical protein
MANKKRVEEELIEKPVEIQQAIEQPVKVEQSVQAGPINCLRNERVIVRYISRPSSMVPNKNHVLYGGMAETATRRFTVPRLSNGSFKNVLTNSEKEYLEEVMGLEINALSVHNRKNNFWDDSNPEGFGRVELHKQDNYLDLSIPEEYIKYKVLLANKDLICPSLEELDERPKATYQFVILSENAKAASNLKRVDAQKNCWKEFGKIEDDTDTLRTVIELVEKRPLAPKTKLDFLQGKVSELIDNDPRKMLSVLTDAYLPAKVLIKRGVEKGIISWRNDLYYLREDGHPLCELGENSTLNNAAKYITSPKNQELKFTIEAKLKE